MGLLDRWVKKKTEEQLDRADKKVSEVKVDDKAQKTTTVEQPAEKKVKKVVKTKAVKKEKKETEGKAVKKSLKSNGIAHKILVKPLVTEKSAVMESRNNKYSFLVSRDADKLKIKEAVRELYGVTPESVNVINVSGRFVRFGKNFGRRSDYKKAIVTLPAGKNITIHEGV